MKYKNPRLKHVKKIEKIISQLWIDTKDLKEIERRCNLLLETKKAKRRKCECKTKYCKHYKSDFERFIEERPEPIKPLNLAHTTTSRPELRQTEKEIMIESKINEIINYLKAL